MTMTKNNNLRSMDVPIMDKVFAMESGWVLNFVNRTFAEFFREELGVDIDHLRWAVQGNSKAKRLRYYLRQADQQTALNALNALWEHREATSVTENYPELDEAVRTAFFKIIERLGGKLPTRVVPSETQPTPRIDGLKAFGRGHSVICMDGLDLHDVLSSRLDIASVLAMKVRRAAETGEAFTRVRDLRLSRNL